MGIVGGGRSSGGGGGVNDDIADINRRRVDLANETSMAIYQSELNLHHSLQDLLIEQGHARQDAFESGNLLPLRNEQKSIQRQEAQLKRDSGRELLAIQRDEQSKQLTLFREFMQAMTASVPRASQSASRSTGTRFGGGSGGSTSFIENRTQTR